MYSYVATHLNNRSIWVRAITYVLRHSTSLSINPSSVITFLYPTIIFLPVHIHQMIIHSHPTSINSISLIDLENIFTIPYLIKCFTPSGLCSLHISQLIVDSVILRKFSRVTFKRKEWERKKYRDLNETGNFQTFESRPVSSYMVSSCYLNRIWANLYSDI